ncbi:MAG: hypothetical protein JSU03_10285 [Bacteroidetes bacterium]|nr:hypothetical protein [Bacteroidota bacterium]MBS1757656.1 hypothetical protein [Bacteroidota bacterium]
MRAEDDIRKFLVLIVNTIAIILIWMIANVLVGIYLGYGFFENKISWKNIVYYILFTVSLFFLIRYIRRKWK